MPNRIKIIISLLILLILSTSLPLKPQSFLITKYSTDNGLPDNRVNDIAQDSLGRIWIAMASGIAMYDGYEWTKYGEKDGVPEVEYGKIKIDEKNVIWIIPKILADNPIIFLKKGKWSKIYFESKKRIGLDYLSTIEIVYNNEKPILYLGSVSYGVLSYKNDSWSQITRFNGLISDSITGINNTKDGIIFSTAKGVSIFQDDKYYTLEIDNYKYNPRVLGVGKIHDISIYNNSILFFFQNWVGRYNGKKIEKLQYNFEFPVLDNNNVHTICIHPSGDIFLANSAAIYVLRKENLKFEKLILETPQSDRGANSVLIDYEGNLWLSTLRGIYKLKYHPFINFNSYNGLLENEVSAISQVKNGDIIFGHNYGFTFNIGSNLKALSFLNDLKKPNGISRILHIYRDLSSNISYFVSNQKGVGKLKFNGEIEWIKNNSPANRFYFIFKNSQGDLYVSTNKGLFKIVGNFISTKKPLLVSLVRCSINLRNYTLLVHELGLTKIELENIQNYKTLSSEVNNLYSINNVGGIGVLVGSKKGLYKFEKDSLIKYNFNNQDITDPIYFIIQDSSKNIWLGTNNGVLKWDGKKLKRYNKSDGLAGNETNRAAGFVDGKGNVWIGTDEGVSMYTGYEPDYSSFPPKVMLLDFKDHTNFSYSINNNNDVDPDKNNLTFYYRGLSFIDEKRNSYQIKLAEVDGDYENEFTTKSTSARFNNLAAGDYIFSVRVQNSKGVWSEWKNSSLITVQDHFYNEPLFYLSVFGLLLFAAFTLNDYYQQKKYTKKLEKAVDERTKDLQATQKELLTTANRYKGIIESQTDLVIRITETGILTFVNDAYCAVFGKKPEDLLGKSFVPFVHPDDIDPTFEEIKKLRYPPYRSTIEQRDLTIEGYRWFSWEGYAILDKGGNVLEIQAVGRDITIQKEVEIELEKRVNQRTIELQSLISQSPLGILTFDSLGRMMTYNNVANDLFGSFKEYLMSSSDFNLLEDQFLMKNNYLESLKTLDSPNSFLLTNPILIDDLNNRIYKNLYNHFLVYRIYNIMLDEKNITYVLMLEDVTEQQMSEEVSKKLLEEKIRISTIIKTIESERDRVARELHDGLGQLLTTAKIKLDIIKLKTDKDLKEIDDTVNVLINAGDEIRRIINDLKPSDVESFGLISSIELLVERVRQSSGIKILLSVLSNIQFPDKNMELIIYRIIQEALNNTIKHSHCNKASIELLTINNELQIHIGDDGVGFDFSMFSEKFKSHGINNIKERVNSLNGKVEIETGPGKGFKYHIRIPL
jgi:PAS domain S-box-containing protein